VPRDWPPSGVIYLPGATFARCYTVLRDRGLTDAEIRGWFRGQNIAPYAFSVDDIETYRREAQAFDRLRRKKRVAERLALARERERSRRERWGHGGPAPESHCFSIDDVETDIADPRCYHVALGWLDHYVASVIRGDVLPELVT
jgi:hypothetical protein